MFALLQNHPFAVEAFFESSLVLAYAVPKEHLITFLPSCLQPDTYNDEWGFIAIAIVKTKILRPKGFPAFLGNDFVLAGYRVFVRYETSAGKNLRGLYILKSETDKKRMAFLGNMFTHYNYSQSDIRITKQNGTFHVSSEKSQLEIEANIEENILLPSTSPFTDWKEARRFAGPLPFTFSYNAAKSEVLIIEGVRENWTPQPITIKKANVGFISALGLPNTRLANAFLVEDIPYYWKKGRTEVWKP